MRNMRFDFVLAGKGYILAKQQGGARSWRRESTPDTPVRLAQRTAENAEYGGLDPQLDYPEVWDDWSGGYGHAYRTSDHPNTYHYAINFDARVPHQLVHCQEPQTLKGYATYSVHDATWLSLLERVDEIVDSTHLMRPGAVGYGKIAILGRGGWVMGYPTGSSIQIDRWQGTTTGSGTFTDDGSRNLHPAATYGSYLYYGLTQGSNGYFYGIGASGLLTASLSGYRFGVAGNQLWKAGGPDPEHATYLQNCGNPAGVATAANWGATYNVGDYQAPILDLIAVDDQVFAGTPVGLYAGDQTGTFVNVLAELRHQVHPDNCRDLAVFEGAVVTPHIAGLFAYRPTTGLVEDLSLPRADRSPVRGSVRALKSYGRYLYAGLYDGSQSWLLAGSRQGQSMVWHTLQQLSESSKVGRLFVDGMTTATGGGVVANRFWMATEASIDPGGTAPVYLWPIPTLDGNPLASIPGFTPNYVATARIDFGATDWGAPGTYKVYRSVELVTENLSPYQPVVQVVVSYSIDNGPYQVLGVAQTSPRQTLYFSPGADAWQTGQSIRLRLASLTNAPSITPVIKGVILRGALLPRYAEEITAVVRIADEMTDRQSQPMRPAQTMLGELRDLAAALVPQELVDLTGATSYVSVLGPPIEQEVWPGAGDGRPEIAATVKLAVLTFSTSSGINVHGNLNI